MAAQNAYSVDFIRLPGLAGYVLSTPPYSASGLLVEGFLPDSR
jgi:hypothetical protein